MDPTTLQTVIQGGSFGLLAWLFWHTHTRFVPALKSVARSVNRMGMIILYTIPAEQRESALAKMLELDKDDAKEAP